MKQQVFYKLSDVVIRTQYDFEFYAELSYMKDFRIPEQDYYDFEVIFEKVKNLNCWYDQPGEFVSDYGPYQFFMNEDGQEYCFFKYGDYLHAVAYLKDRQVRCYYISQHWLQEITSGGFSLENFFLTEKILMESKAMVLHSCHIQKDGKAILFSAPSGTGKSTQGELWRKYADAEVVNGDRTIIRHVENQWMAYGAPFCGTSGISLNKEAPLKAVVVLKQAPKNRVRMMQGREAFYAIYSEVTVHGWDKAYVDAALDWITDLLKDVPIVMFECTKEPDAVEVLRGFLEEKRFI